MARVKQISAQAAHTRRPLSSNTKKSTTNPLILLHCHSVQTTAPANEWATHSSPSVLHQRLPLEEDSSFNTFSLESPGGTQVYPIFSVFSRFTWSAGSVGEPQPILSRIFTKSSWYRSWSSRWHLQCWHMFLQQSIHCLWSMFTKVSVIQS